ncbi:hypothetical protein ACWGCI_24280 [Streptomyces sp. NPDC054949]
MPDPERLTHPWPQQHPPTLPVPVGRDQPFWASRLTALGLAPTSLPIRQVTTANLTHSSQNALMHLSSTVIPLS